MCSLNLKDFSVENLETTHSTFLSKFSSEIYLSRIINYWGSIFTLYLKEEAFRFVCVPSTFLFFLLLFSFYINIFLRDTYYSQDSRELRGNQMDSRWDLFSLEIWILFTFSLMQLSWSYWLSHFKVALWGFELISNYHPSITKRTA